LKEEALDRTMWRNRFGRGFWPVVWQITDDDDEVYFLYVKCIVFPILRITRLWLQAGRSRVLFPMVTLEFFIDIILPVALWPGVDSVSKRNEYQEYFLGSKGCRCIRLTTLPPSCSDCLEIWKLQPPGTLRACPGL